MATPVEKIFTRFLSQIEDESWLEIEEEILIELMYDYLVKSIVEFNVCKKDLTIDFDNDEIVSDLSEDEVLILANRSSNPGKKGLILANSIGVIDSDYYGNPDNDGHIMFAFFNIKDEDIEIKKGDAIGQGIFQKFLTVDEDLAEGERMGGFGSTSKK